MNRGNIGKGVVGYKASSGRSFSNQRDAKKNNPDIIKRVVKQPQPPKKDIRESIWMHGINSLAHSLSSVDDEINDSSIEDLNPS
jgi:hypothetical protein